MGSIEIETEGERDEPCGVEAPSARRQRQPRHDAQGYATEPVLWPQHRLGSDRSAHAANRARTAQRAAARAYQHGISNTHVHHPLEAARAKPPLQQEARREFEQAVPLTQEAGREGGSIKSPAKTADPPGSIKRLFRAGAKAFARRLDSPPKLRRRGKGETDKMASARPKLRQAIGAMTRRIARISRSTRSQASGRSFSGQVRTLSPVEESQLDVYTSEVEDIFSNPLDCINPYWDSGYADISSEHGSGFDPQSNYLSPHL
jgi:hypothetical protein